MSDIIPQKRCTKCGNEYPSTVDYFYVDSAQCKECVKARNRAWNHAHREWYAEKARAYRHANPERARASYRKNRERHRERINERSRQDYRARTERRKEIDHACKARHREQYNAKVLEYTNIHREERRAYNRLYHKTHPEKVRVANHARAARKRKAAGKHTAQDIQVQFQRQRGRCYYCKQKLTKYEVDHIVPLSRGGSNDPSNLVIACKPCNNSKHNKLPHEWPKGGRLL